MSRSRFLVNEHPNYSVKHPKILYIDRYGNIYPDCKTYKSAIICHLTDECALDKIRDAIFAGEDGIFNMITIEVSSLCQADCFYCFQRDDHRRDAYPYYEALMKTMRQLKAYWVFFSGGEILIQPEALRFMREFKGACPDAWIHLKTNGNSDEEGAAFVDEVCDSIMVSFNGFSTASYRTIMGLNIEKTIAFCERVKASGKTNLGLKLLNSPITVVETAPFLDWALALEARCIAIQTAYNYSVEPSGKSHRLNITLAGPEDSPYWKAVYQRISHDIGCVIDAHAAHINNGCNYLTADREFISLMSLSREHAERFRTDGVYIIE